MNPEEQRVAIAEACGWTICRIWNWNKGKFLKGSLVGNHPDTMVTQYIPRYTSDLNAMHAAIQSQSQAFRAEFDRLLHALAEEKHLLITELTAQDWADTFIKVYESN